MTPLVSLDEAKYQVGSTQAEDDVQLDLYAQLATGIVIDFVGVNDPVTGAARGWTEATVPDSVKAAILQLVANLWAHRGDEEQNSDFRASIDDLPPQARRWLVRYREPVVA